ncbi:MAG: NAD-dependent epimerase/dehydratase family protein [Proteobacteria bacterium]|nr:NAD-dependent epimerase/dehydratase family protein [Pseudomonadota bacterium]
MKIVITGGAGFLGRKLAARLTKQGFLWDRTGKKTGITGLVLADVAAVDPPIEGATAVVGDIADPHFMAGLIGEDVDTVFHLAAVVSGQAEAEFDVGMRVNLDATRALIERLRSLGTRPRLIFSSTLAVYGNTGGGISPSTPVTPLSSYGTQKAMNELLIGDMTRKGFIDGRSLRLPTVVIRPGKPNLAASSFASSILREPLSGERTACPVAKDLRVLIISPRRVIDAFVHTCELPAETFAGRGPVNLPGLSLTVGDMVEGLERAGGDSSLIEWTPDANIQRIVDTWPGTSDTRDAEDLGYLAETGIDDLIAAYLEDERRE